MMKFDFKDLDNDWSVLLDILSYKRHGGSVGEKMMLKKHIIPNVDAKDTYGNYYSIIGDNPTIMWSSHTDTVHNWHTSNRAPKQSVYYDTINGDIYGGGGDCLGADCGAGVALMLQMIDKQVPGLYVFHREEEWGGGGSSWIVKENPDLVKGIKACIAFDRYGTDEVITYQQGRCCSDKFAQSLAQLLNDENSGFNYYPSEWGVFTDSANYVELIGECTNISVGYYDHHTVKERQDLLHLDKLCTAMVNIDWSKLEFEREPGEVDYYEAYSQYMKNNYTVINGDKKKEYSNPDIDDMEEIIKRYPRMAALMFEEYGFKFVDLVDEFEAKGADVTTVPWHSEIEMMN